MAKAKKRKEKLKQMAGYGQTVTKAPSQSRGEAYSSKHPGEQYIKYGDLHPKTVHEGLASYGGSDYADIPATNVGEYSVAVKRGHGLSNFIFQGKLYQINNSSGSSYSLVPK